MTCAACVGVVENALKGVTGVNLLMKRAEVKHRGREDLWAQVLQFVAMMWLAPGVPVADLLEAVEDVGFDAELMQELQVETHGGRLGGAELVSPVQVVACTGDCGRVGDL
eukprot:Skav232915  [mRNA]  locus=scaffold1477:654118:656926:- [translate_table: standard]